MGDSVADELARRLTAPGAGERQETIGQLADQWYGKDAWSDELVGRIADMA